MSLVINSNESTSFKVNNNEFRSFPDFNQILIMPSCGNVGNGATIANGPTAYSISGTKVNYLSGAIENPSIFFSNGIWKTAYINMRNTNCNATFRVGSDFQLPAGKVVGKEIILKLIVFNEAGGFNKNFNLTVGLLHTNGTITNIINNQGQTGVSGPIVEQRWTTNGVVSLAGDYVICDIHLQNTSYPGNTDGLFGFGNPGSTPAYPIQISIE